MEGRAVSGLAHVCLYVRDLKRSVAFYRKLGFTERFGFTRQGRDFGVYLDIGRGQFIELFEDPGLTGPVFKGSAHFCLESPDIDAAVALLDREGIAHGPKKLGGDQTWQVWLDDPDGNSFEIHQYTPHSYQHCGGTMEADW